MRLWFAVLGVSVLTTYQHHFIDVPTGALLGFLCLWLWPDGRPSPLAQISRVTDRRAAACPGDALRGCRGALAIAGVALGGAALWLLWPAVSLALVAANYAVFGAGGFQKGPDGRMSLAALALFLPYLIGAWINSRLWTRHDDEAAAVGDGVFIGRNPWPRAAREFAAVVDLCAELPGSAGSRQIPLLDLVAPTPESLAVAATTIEQARSGGPCAGLLRPWLWAQRGRGSCLADGDGARNKRRGGGRSDSPRPTSGRPRSRRAGGGGAGGTPCMIGGADTVERDLAAAAAALLDQGQRADHLSRLITAAAIVLLLLPSFLGPPPVLLTTILALVVLLGLVELYFAIRVGFDAALFHRWGAVPDGFDCARLDRALLRLGLMPEAKTGRPIAERIAGARRLLAWQGVTLAAQVLLVLVGAALSVSLARSGG